MIGRSSRAGGSRGGLDGCSHQDTLALCGGAGLDVASLVAGRRRRGDGGVGRHL